MNTYELIGILLFKLGDSPYSYRHFKPFIENGYNISPEFFEQSEDEDSIVCVIKVEKDKEESYFKFTGWTSSEGEAKMNLSSLKQVTPKEKIVKEWV